MRTQKQSILTVMLAIFLWSQFCSLFGALESFALNSLDDIDAEEIVTLDPFLFSTGNRTVQEIEILQVIVVGLACLLAPLWQTVLARYTSKHLLHSPVPPGNRLWLRQRRLLI